VASLKPSPVGTVGAPFPGLGLARSKSHRLITTRFQVSDWPSNHIDQSWLVPVVNVTTATARSPSSVGYYARKQRQPPVWARLLPPKMYLVYTLDLQSTPSWLLVSMRVSQ